MSSSRTSTTDRGGAGLSVFPVAVVVSVLALALGLVNADFGGGAGDPPPATVTAAVSATPTGRVVPAGFLGLSLEYWAIESYAGTDPSAIAPLFVRLIRNLTPSQSPVLRIGGDSADWTWWPVPGMARPAGVSFSLDANWVAVTQALTRALGARLILGLNLQADSAQLAATEAQHLLSGIDAGSIAAFEIGNEPSIYGLFPWYRTASGQGVESRPHSYDFAAFLNDFTRVSAALPAHALAGPTIGGLGWAPYLSRFLATEPRVRLVTVHQYPLQLCRTSRGSSRYPTLGHLLSPAASTQFAAGFAGTAAVAHRTGLPIRIDELNSVSCGATPAVSQSFAAALWAPDALFGLLQAGLDGVQMHTFPGAGYQLFTFHHAGTRLRAAISPEYYGLLLFAAAAPVGSRLLAVSARADPTLRLWATRGRDGRTRVLLINTAPSRARTVRLAIPGAGRPAALERLRGPGVAALSGVSLAGQSFGAQTSTGDLTGRRRLELVPAAGGRYAVGLPAASAALLTVS